jgi:cardiolipin synthase
VIGGVVDPISDKALVMTVTLCLTASGAIPWWLSAAIISRDVGLLGCSLYIRHVSLRAHFDDVTWRRFWDFGYPSVVVSPTELSKVNTVLQVFTLLCSIAAPAAGLAVGDPHPALLALWAATTATTLASGAGYVFSNDALVFLRPPHERLLHRLPRWAHRRLEKRGGGER